MRDNRVIIKLIGVTMAIIGTVIVIHTVPVFVWYILLIVLVIVFTFVMLNQ